MANGSSVQNGNLRAACVLTLLALVLGPRGAAAEAPSAEARYAAAALGEEADRLAAEGDRYWACLAYGDSYRLNPELATLLHWAECLEREGKVASAYAAFQDAVSLGRRLGDARSEAAERRRALLGPRLSYITVAVPADHRLPGLVIDRDGFRLGSASWGMPVATDPGRHRIHATAAGYQSLELTVDLVGDGAVSYVEIPNLEPQSTQLGAPQPAAAANVAPLASASPSSAALPPTEPPPQALEPRPKSAARRRKSARKWSSTQWAGLVVGEVGLVGLATSLYFFGKERSTLDARDRICPSGKDCEPGTNQLLHDLSDDAVRSQRTGFVCLGIGAAAAAIGVALWSSPHAKASGRQRAALSISSAGPWGGGLFLKGEL